MPRILRNYLICFAVIGAILLALDLVDSHFLGKPRRIPLGQRFPLTQLLRISRECPVVRAELVEA